MINFKNKKILITGGSFIGFHLIKKLIDLGASHIRIVNLTNKNKKILIKNFKDIEFYAYDLRDIEKARKSVKKIDIVFHLAADHGGRGYVALKQSNTATNFILDGLLFKACLENKVEKIFYASSGCVYPNFLQKEKNKKIYLKESNVKPPYDADNLYGWAKLMGELTLKQYYKDYGLKSAIGRFFTVYGPYAKESHAVMATIAKAFIKQDPFEVWGDGEQIRNWTYVEDIVDGIIKLIEKVDDATPVNLGTEERIKVIDMVNLVFKYTGFYPKKIKFLSMPTGPINRVADISLAKKLLNWQPKYDFKTGLKKTVEWYFKNKNKDFIKKNLKKLLI
jgi:UDP-glucose 4-epimerase